MANSCALIDEVSYATLVGRPARFPRVSLIFKMKVTHGADLIYSPRG